MRGGAAAGSQAPQPLFAMTTPGLLPDVPTPLTVPPTVSGLRDMNPRRLRHLVLQLMAVVMVHMVQQARTPRGHRHGHHTGAEDPKAPWNVHDVVALFKRYTLDGTSARGVIVPHLVMIAEPGRGKAFVQVPEGEVPLGVPQR